MARSESLKNAQKRYANKKPDAIKKALSKYNNNFVRLTIKLHKVDDKQLIDFIKTKENKNKYFKELIRQDITRHILNNI